MTTTAKFEIGDKVRLAKAWGDDTKYGVVFQVVSSSGPRRHSRIGVNWYDSNGKCATSFMTPSNLRKF